MRVADGMLELDDEPDAVPRARRWLADHLAGTPFEDVLPDAELVVSELATNALLHGRPPVRVHLALDDEVVRIEVFDASRVGPLRARASTDAMTGRGLSLVAALARDWGVEQRPGGKVVWCELAATSAELPDIDTDVDALLAAWDDHVEEIAADPGPRRYEVSLGDVPTDLLLAAKAHVDNLVREFTLAAHGAESGRTAAVPPHLAELIEAVTTGFAEARQAIKKQALDAASRGAERTTLTLNLPASAADAGERYVEALDEVDSYARAARLLTLETPPQHRVFRRWYVEALVQQLRAAAAGGTPPPAQPFERRLLAEVAVVEVARRAAERAARLQSVTAALAATTTAKDVGNVVVTEGVAALGASGGTLMVHETDERLGVTAAVGYGEELVEKLRSESREAELPAAYALRTGEAVWLESREERDERFPELTGLEPGTVSMCAVPLRAGDHVLGALRFSFDVARLFDADERRFVTTLANQTAQALERADALAEARVASDRLALLAGAAVALAESLDYRTTLRTITRLAVPRLADWCAVHLIEDGRIEVAAVHHVDPAKIALADDLQRRYPVDPADETGIALAIRTGESELYQDITDEMLVAGARDDEHLALMRTLGFSSGLLVPLAARDHVFGTLAMFYAESGRHYGDDDLKAVGDLARLAALAIDNASRYRALGG